jgi:hypothetical protein
MALECLPGREYDEDTFLYFLDVERSRANRSNHALRLLLVSVESVPGKPIPLRRATAVRLFAGLRESLRETDVMGWYRQDQVAGAVLRARPDADGPEMSRIIRKRVDEEFRRRLRPADMHTLRVRMIELRRALGN